MNFFLILCSIYIISEYFLIVEPNILQYQDNNSDQISNQEKNNRRHCWFNGNAWKQSICHAWWFRCDPVSLMFWYDTRFTHPKKSEMAIISWICWDVIEFLINGYSLYGKNIMKRGIFPYDQCLHFIATKFQNIQIANLLGCERVSYQWKGGIGFTMECILSLLHQLKAFAIL